MGDVRAASHPSGMFRDRLHTPRSPSYGDDTMGIIIESLSIIKSNNRNELERRFSINEE